MYRAIAEANDLFEEGRYGEAQRAYRKALRLSPGDERAHCGMTVSLMLDKKTREAAECARNLARLRPGEAYPHGVLGTLLEKMGRLDEAIVCYGRMLEIDPGRTGARFQMAMALSARGRDSEAGRALGEAMDIRPSGGTDEGLQLKLWDLYRTRDDDSLDGRLTVDVPGMEDMLGVLYRRADTGGSQGHAQDYLDYLSGRAGRLADAGRYAEALARVADFLRLRPGDAEVLLTKGMLLEKLGRPADAARCYDEVIRASPGEAPAYHLKCGLLAAAGDADGLLECYRAALDAGPSEDGASLQMRKEHRELDRCLRQSGSAGSGLAEFMETAGVAARPRWGRKDGEPRAGRRPGRRLRAGRRA